VTGREHLRCAMRHQTVILPILQLYIPGMQRRSDVQTANSFRPRLGRQSVLAGNSAGERIACSGKRDQERIAGLLDFLSAVAPELRPQQRMMGGERGAENLSSLLPERRRPFAIAVALGARRRQPMTRTKPLRSASPCARLAGRCRPRRSSASPRRSTSPARSRARPSWSRSSGRAASTSGAACRT